MLQFGYDMVDPVLLTLLALELAAAQNSVGHQNASLCKANLLRTLALCMNKGPQSSAQEGTHEHTVQLVQ